jgi:hypothetical protein
MPSAHAASVSATSLLFIYLSLFERRRCDNASDLTASNRVIALP